MSRTTNPFGKPNLLFYVKMGVLCALMVYMGAMVRRPFIIAGRMEADNSRLESKLREVRQENQRLKKQGAALATDAGMEREARRLGYVREGEAHLQIAGQPRR